MGEDGWRTSLLSSVRRTATPASTLPTVREINIMVCDALMLFL